MKEEKIKKIQELFGHLYCFNPKQTEDWMSKVVLMKEEGLDELIQALEEGMKRQATLIEGWVKKVPEFGVALLREWNRSFKRATRDSEKIERGSAEKILLNID